MAEMSFESRRILDASQDRIAVVLMDLKRKMIVSYGRHCWLRPTEMFN